MSELGHFIRVSSVCKKRGWASTPQGVGCKVLKKKEIIKKRETLSYTDHSQKILKGSPLES